MSIGGHLAIMNYFYLSKKRVTIFVHDTFQCFKSVMKKRPSSFVQHYLVCTPNYPGGSRCFSKIDHSGEYRWSHLCSGNYFCRANAHILLLLVVTEISMIQQERRRWHRSGVVIVNFKHILHLVLVFLLLTFY